MVEILDVMATLAKSVKLLTLAERHVHEFATHQNDAVEQAVGTAQGPRAGPKSASSAPSR
jgi:hypothetical protein